MINMVVGFDQREAVAYHAFCQSVISRTSRPVRFTPLVAHGVDGKRNGSNAFIYSRFLVPYLNEYKGWAIYADGDGDGGHLERHHAGRDAVHGGPAQRHLAGDALLARGHGEPDARGRRGPVAWGR